MSSNIIDIIGITNRDFCGASSRRSSRGYSVRSADAPHPAHRASQLRTRDIGLPRPEVVRRRLLGRSVDHRGRCGQAGRGRRQDRRVESCLSRTVARAVEAVGARCERDGPASRQQPRDTERAQEMARLAGLPVGLQQKMMRQASVTTTMDRYGSALKWDMRAASAKIMELVSTGFGENQVAESK